jgi:lipoprotein NlpI
MMEIHILRDGKQFGPYTEEESKAYLAQGSLLPDDLAWYEGQADWIPLSKLLEAANWKVPPPPAANQSKPAPTHKAPKPFWALGAFVVLVLLATLYFCTPYLPLHPLQALLGPTFPKDFGCYIKKGTVWTPLSSPEGLATLQATAQPELLIFDRRLGVAPVKAEDIVQLIPNIYIRNYIETVLVRKDQPPEKYTIAKTGTFVPSNQFIAINSSPIKDQPEMLVVSPAHPLDRNNYTLNILDEKIAFHSGNNFANENELPQSIVFDKWYTTITDKGFSWDGWLALTQKNLGEERQYNNRSIVSIEYKKPDAYNALLKQLATELAGYATNGDVESMVAFRVRIKDLDAKLFQNATSQVLDKAKGVVKDATTNREWPVVKGVTRLVLDSGIEDQELSSANSNATVEMTQIENDTRSKVLNVIDESKKIGNEIASFSCSDFPMGQSDSLPITVTDNAINYKAAYQSGSIQLCNIGEVTKRNENSSWDSKRVYYCVTIKANNNQVEFPFIDESSRDKLFDTILKVRQGWDEKYKDSACTDVIAFPKYFSESVFVGDTSYALHTTEDAVEYEILTDKNDRYTVEPNKNIQISNASSLQFRSLLGNPVHVHIQRFPWNVALAYYSRGVDEENNHDNPNAIIDLEKAIAANPKYPEAYRDRGLIKSNGGDFDGAISDLDKAIEFNSQYADAYRDRGHDRQIKGAFSDAIDDFHEYITLLHDDYQRIDYAYLYIWLMKNQRGIDSKPDIDQELSDYLTRRTSLNMLAGDWVSHIGDFLLGRITESDFIDAANTGNTTLSQGRHCEAWYFVGMKHFLSGDKQAAIDFFQKSIGTGQSDYLEYSLAQSELKALGGGSVATNNKVIAPSQPGGDYAAPAKLTGNQTIQDATTATQTLCDQSFPINGQTAGLTISDAGIKYSQPGTFGGGWTENFADITGFKDRESWSTSEDALVVITGAGSRGVYLDTPERKREVYAKLLNAYAAWAAKYPTFAKIRKLFGPTLKDSDQGILIGSIMPGSPADKAGIKVGDFITKLDGENSVGMKASEFVYELRQKDSHDMEVVSSDGVRRTIHVEMAYPWTFATTGQ